METKQSMITGKIKYAFGALKSFIMDNHGDTMIEILIAFTMLTICLGTLTGILSFASKMIQMSKDQDVAQAQYDEESAKIFSSDTAYDKEPISLLTYSFNGIFSMDLNSASVDVKDKTLNIFSTSGEDSSSYIKSLSVDNIAAPTQFGDNEVIFPKTTLEASITRVNNNTSKTEELNDEEKRSLTITLTSDAKAAGISLSEDKEAGTFTINYPSTVAGNEYSLNAAYPTGTSPVSCNFNVLFGPIEGKIEKSVTLFADTSAERSSLGFGSTAKESVQVEFNKDSDKVTSDWDDLVGPDGSNTLFVAIGYEFKGWVLCDFEGNIQKDENNKEIIITGTDTSKVNVYNLENKMKEYIFDPEDTRTEYYFKAKVEEVSSGAMLCTNLKDRINNLTGKAEVSIKRETENLTDTSDWTRVDIANEDPGDTLNGKKLSELYTTPIFMKYEGETLWWYSEANTVFMAPVSYNNVFEKHKSLKSIEGLKDWDASYITSFRKGFYECTSLENINALSSWKCYNVTNLSCCFQNCTSLAELEPLKNWDVSKVNANDNFKDIFNGCTSIKDIDGDLDGWKFNSAITSVNNIFSGMTNLETLEVDWSEEGSMPGVTNADSLFKGHNSLKNVKLKWNAPKITSLKQIFDSCKGLLHARIDFNVPIAVHTYRMFFNCTSLLDVVVDMPELKLYNVAEGGANEMFSGCSSLKEAEVNMDLSNSGCYMKDFFKNCSNLEKATNSCESNYEKDENGKYKPLIRPTKFNNMFYGCKKLVNASFAKYLSFEKVGSYGGVFNGCTSLNTEDLIDILSTWDLKGRDNVDVGIPSTINSTDTFTDYSGNTYKIVGGIIKKQ